MYEMHLFHEPNFLTLALQDWNWQASSDKSSNLLLVFHTSTHPVTKIYHTTRLSKPYNGAHKIKNRKTKYCANNIHFPSVLWRCWLCGRKGIRPVKTELWGAGVVISLERGADLHMAQLIPLPLTVSCFSKIQIGFTFLVPAHPGSPGHWAVKRVCVCVQIIYI